MTTPSDYDFAQQKIMSNGQAVSSEIRDVLLEKIPGAVAAYKSELCNDKTGVDWWVEMAGARHLAVDVKVREQDWAASHPDQDDLAIETFSVLESQKIGWSLDETKRCDFVLWFWKDTRRTCLISFPQLCRVCRDHWQRWSKDYKVARQRTRWLNGSHYHSECVFVPRKEIWNQLYRTYAGSPQQHWK